MLSYIFFSVFIWYILICNVVFVSAVQKSESVIQIHRASLLKFFSHLYRERTLLNTL